MAEQDSGQRQRVAAILAADVAGYSRLMADDETATIAALDDARAVFAEHITANQGRVVDTAGDSVLSVFETTAGAVEAAMAVQAELIAAEVEVPEARRMRFRIGVHLGDIHEKTDGTIYGDGVNIAARLEGLAAPGSVAVSDAVQATIRGRVSFGFADLGEHKVKNIEHPVRAYRVLAEGEAAPAAAPKRVRLLTVAGAAAVALAIVAGVLLWPKPEPPAEVATAETEDAVPALAIGPAIAVLPFDESAGEDDWFADGIAEDILTRLSRFTTLKVIARNSSFQYKGQAVDVRQVGHDLGADYVLEGSVRRTADTVRVTVQLLDARDGAHIWAETYDRALTTEDLFALQDDITTRIASAIGGNFGAIATARIRELQTRAPETLESYECVLLAYRFQRVDGDAAHLAARNCLEAAVEREPDYVDGLAWLGQMYIEEYWSDLNPRSEGLPSLEAALAVLNRALILDPNHQMVRHALAYAYYMKGNLGEFRLQAKKALSINPNNNQTFAEVAWMTAYSGEWDRGLELFFQLEDKGATIPAWLNGVPFLYYYRLGEYSRALDYGRNFLELSRWPYSIRLAMVHAQLGNADEARAALAETRRREPDLSATMVREAFGRLIADASVVEKLMQGYEKALAFEAEASSQRPVIAVLPFDNLSNDPEQDYFVDGLTEEIIAALTRFDGLGVIARNSTFTYKGRAVDVREVGTQLGADYVVEGSMRKAAETIRVTVQLIDAASGNHLWAETYERQLSAANLFAVQDDITGRIVATLADSHGAIGRARLERAEASRTDSLDSYDCILRHNEFRRRITAAAHLVARDCLERAVERDPDYAEAWARLANIYALEYAFGFNKRPELYDAMVRNREAATRAAELDPQSEWTHLALARSHFFHRYSEQFFFEAERAVALNPNNADILATAGLFVAHAGDWQRGLALVEQAMALNPSYPLWYHSAFIGDHYAKREYDAALARARQMSMPGFYWTHLFFACIYGQLGDQEAAKAAVAELLAVYPTYAEEAYENLRKWYHSEDHIAHIIDGLRKAGLDIPEVPEG
jgi:adenylate cyclase